MTRPTIVEPLRRILVHDARRGIFLAVDRIGRIEVHPWSHGDYQVVMHDGARLSWSRRYRAQSVDPFGSRF